VTFLWCASDGIATVFFPESRITGQAVGAGQHPIAGHSRILKGVAMVFV
jgi:hypothetical protein